jgi:hypothetical protein
MIEPEDLDVSLIGALVVFNDGRLVPEYGLIQSFNSQAGLVFVRFGLGDTAAGCRLEDLTVLVPTIRPSDRDELVRLRRE